MDVKRPPEGHFCGGKILATNGGISHGRQSETNATSARTISSLECFWALFSLEKQGGPGSVRFGYGLGVERFERFRFSVPAVPLQKGVFCVFQDSLTGKNGSGSGSWKTVPAVPVPLSVSGKTVPTVPVSGSGSVPEPPCN